MKFRYELSVKKLPEPITHFQKLMLVGSCFTENIGEKLDKYKFTTLQNPNGILFNPVSVSEAIASYIDEERFDENDLFYLNEAWHSWKHHSRYSGVTPADALTKINTAITAAHQFLKEADNLILTLGSAWTYTLTEKALNTRPGAVAANNHKAPSNWFQRQLMAPHEVLNVLRVCTDRLFRFNEHIKVIFTISPVRHLREGAVENNRSKAVLIQAVHQLVEESDRIHYFPAYELVIDDLRDYRFYAEDLVHPNYFATQYVWEKMVDACMDEPTKSLIDQLHTINLAFQHKPFNPASAAHKAFRQMNLKKVIALQERYPFLHLKKEIEFFSE